MNVNLEYPASSAIHDLAGVARLQEKVQAPNLKLFLDMLYVFWAQDTPEAIQAIAPERFGLIHLCDCPKDHYLRDRTETMRARREYPGLGAIPLVPILKALPKNPCSIELPNEDYIHRLFVGDQLFTDVWGAKKCGIMTYLTKPIHPKEEIQIVLKRYLEKIVLFFYHREKRRKGNQNAE